MTGRSLMGLIPIGMAATFAFAAYTKLLLLVRHRGDIAELLAQHPFGRFNSAVFAVTVALEATVAALLVAIPPVGLAAAAASLCAFTAYLLRLPPATACFCFGSRAPSVQRRDVARNTSMLGACALGLMGLVAGHGPDLVPLDVPILAVLLLLGFSVRAFFTIMRRPLVQPEQLQSGTWALAEEAL